MPSESSRDFLRFQDLDADTILSIVARAQVLATAWTDRAMPQSLAGKRVAVIVDDGGRADQLLQYQISAPLLDRCRRDVIFLPCPPVTRGKEVSATAMTHPACQSTAAKAFLLHAQNALLEWVAA
ncbi:hypothetical protein CVM73_24200 [Bradyrhizobium forestalis]|uniref:Aspartate/ornithine carbamoyltransferase Asp/Orn-binding domain-containing protein n=1 Tax=Bradyrhizobium forestalis TaxID=1419263 RepID=A0A2M8R4J3_9BRAD|nr:hypothetical protein [Bradyrhizobium forestalis]PJG52739.1 hypothetical protein CVM73_24200 [Bradyrhizobium forestalis]